MFKISANKFFNSVGLISGSDDRSPEASRTKISKTHSAVDHPPNESQSSAGSLSPPILVRRKSSGLGLIRSSSATASRPKQAPRVSFNEGDLSRVHDIWSKDEYDRRADKHAHLNIDEMRELAKFCEYEMQVHRKSKDTTHHLYLHGKGKMLKQEVKRKIEHANGKEPKRSAYRPPVITGYSSQTRFS